MNPAPIRARAFHQSFDVGCTRISTPGSRCATTGVSMPGPERTLVLPPEIVFAVFHWPSAGCACGVAGTGRGAAAATGGGGVARLGGTCGGDGAGAGAVFGASAKCAVGPLLHVASTTSSS